jgi:hypothetical protein
LSSSPRDAHRISWAKASQSSELGAPVTVSANMRGSVKLGENDWDERRSRVGDVGDDAIHKAGEIDHRCGEGCPSEC